MITKAGRINNHFSWVNQQPWHKVDNGRLYVKTDPKTDLWQGTFYGFDPDPDNGHGLLTKVTHDFSMTVRTELFPKQQYDQCGLFVRGNSRNWIKASTEYEDKKLSRIGSVVTNRGWSDWATLDDTSGVTLRWYRIRSRIESNLKDFIIEYSDAKNPRNDKSWHQLRIAHLHENFASLSIGIYACSPKEEGGFEAIFDRFSLVNSDWRRPDKANGE